MVSQCVKSISHSARAMELGIAAAALATQSKMQSVTSVDHSLGNLRIMQWNILADGMADDGFLVEDVLDGKDDLLAGSSLQAAVADVRHTKKMGADMAAVKEKYVTARSQKNHLAVTDWALRWARMKDMITHFAPDVITVQEMDRMEQAQVELKTLGYESALPLSDGGSHLYRPSHEAVLQVGMTKEYVAHLQSKGVAFAPNLPSTARNMAEKANNTSADDDGPGVFWRSDVLIAEALDFLPCKDQSKRHSAAVRVTLRRKSDQRQIHVLCAHLSSGDKDKDELARMQEITQASPLGGLSFVDWVAQSMESAPTILCMDSNSSPTRAEASTVWKALRGINGVRSVWDEHFDADGKAKTDTLLATTNKMRGPLSNQAAKIGEHMCHVIDHIFYSDSFSLSGHVWSPLTWASKEEACKHLLPSLAIPSDHAPVIVDVALAAKEDDEPPLKKARL